MKEHIHELEVIGKDEQICPPGTPPWSKTYSTPVYKCGKCGIIVPKKAKRGFVRKNKTLDV